MINMQLYLCALSNTSRLGGYMYVHGANVENMNLMRECLFSLVFRVMGLLTFIQGNILCCCKHAFNIARISW